MRTLVEIRSYIDLPLAELAKSKLESEGIYCFLHSKYHIGLKWYISQALGGVRVLVIREDAERAIEVLDTDESEILKTIDFPPPDTGDYCYNCGSENLKQKDLRVYSFILLVLTGLPFIFWGSFTECNNCGTKN